MSILNLPGASITPLEKNPLVTNLFFVPLARASGVPGVLVDQIEYGAFKISWKQFDYIVYVVTYPAGFGKQSQYFVLHEGPEEASRLYLLAAGAYADGMHEEIWVFEQGFWRKSHGLWLEVQKASWDDVILKDAFKKALQKDVYGFFASEALYKELAIPWKRGLIMYGPPGNGKTISLKTIMKTCGDKGFAPLYVKSFQSYKGEEGAMADVFEKARQYAPCVVILEDLDSLINDRNRSFFLNQLDGLEDPGLSTRPSRFDRKFKFDDPDEEERKLYVQYWQKKLAANVEIDFPDRLVDKVARLTDRFSFAYLKEAFVSTLVTLLGIEGKKPTFESVLVDQINALRKQLDKSVQPSSKLPHFTPDNANGQIYNPGTRQGAPTRPPRPDTSTQQGIRDLLDALSERAPRVGSGIDRIYQGGSTGRPQTDLPHFAQDHRDIRVLLDSLSDSLASLDLPSIRASETGPQSSAPFASERKGHVCPRRQTIPYPGWSKRIQARSGQPLDQSFSNHPSC
ncbi:P-loop containing nucleoside triphosphate hydrolase protein [Agrocybe pediades]|nr:P-loop containing nucleoside triphosphate hydrolase protein [Agrocybe pediades]